jgi:hypothetical protein
MYRKPDLRRIYIPVLFLFMYGMIIGYSGRDTSVFESHVFKQEKFCSDLFNKIYETHTERV